MSKLTEKLTELFPAPTATARSKPDASIASGADRGAKLARAALASFARSTTQSSTARRLGNLEPVILTSTLSGETTMKGTFNPSSTAARTLKEIIEDGKVTIGMAIEGLERIEDELNGDLEAGYKALYMSGDLARQIEMLQALQGKIRRSIGAPMPTPAPYRVLESSPT